jgi:plastocyanin
VNGVHANDVEDEQTRIAAEAADREAVLGEITARLHGGNNTMTTVRRLFLLTFLVAIACAPPPEREITVGLAEYAFIPSTIEVATAQRVRITVRNTGRTEHDFNPDQRGVALGLSHLHLAPGASQSFDWTPPLDATEVRINCTIVGHEGLGMVAKLVVLPRQ